MRSTLFARHGNKTYAAETFLICPLIALGMVNLTRISSKLTTCWRIPPKKSCPLSSPETKCQPAYYICLPNSLRILPNFVIMIDQVNGHKCFLPKHTINIALFRRLAFGSMCYTSLTILMISFFRLSNA